MDSNELIDLYFRGLLTEEEKSRVEELLQTDPEFAEEFEFHQATQDALKLNKRNELKGFLQDLDKVIKSSDKPRKILPWVATLKIAAGLSVILVLTFLVFNMNKTTEDSLHSDTFLSFYEPYPNVVSPITRGEELNPADLEKAGFIAYESKNYRLADSLFTKVLPYQQDYINFYKGISKFEMEQYDSAAKYFDNYLYSEGTQLRDQAKWYMALSYLVKGDTVKGKEELIRLRKSSGYKMDEVERILLSLE